MRREYEALNKLIGRNFAVLNDGMGVYLTPKGEIRDIDGRLLLPELEGRARLFERNLEGSGGGGGDVSGGKDGITPHIGPNGNWFLGSTDTGVKARGEDGYTPSRGTDYWTAEDEAWMKGEIQTYVNNYLINGAW